MANISLWPSQYEIYFQLAQEWNRTIESAKKDAGGWWEKTKENWTPKLVSRDTALPPGTIIIGGCNGDKIGSYTLDGVTSNDPFETGLFSDDTDKMVVFEGQTGDQTEGKTDSSADIVFTSASGWGDTYRDGTFELLSTTCETIDTYKCEEIDFNTLTYSGDYNLGSASSPIWANFEEYTLDTEYGIWNDTGDFVGLFSDGGHYILLMGTLDSTQDAMTGSVYYLKIGDLTAEEQAEVDSIGVTEFMTDDLDRFLVADGTLYRTDDRTDDSSG